MRPIESATVRAQRRPSSGWSRIRPGRDVLLVLLGLVGVLFVAVPLAALFFHLSGSGLVAALEDPEAHAAIITSLLSATIATALASVFGIPLAYVLARYTFPGRSLLGGLVYLPLVLPPVVGGILLLVVWGPYGTIGGFFDAHGVDFVDHISGIVLAQMFVASPFVVVASRSAFEGIDPDLEDMALVLGADRLRIFWSVALPLALRAILAGAALSWMRAFGEFGATVMMAYHPYSFPIYNYVQFSSVGLGPVLPLALLAMILGAFVLVISAILQQLRWW